MQSNKSAINSKPSPELVEGKGGYETHRIGFDGWFLSLPKDSAAACMMMIEILLLRSI